jgi:hypothetical protein
VGYLCPYCGKDVKELQSIPQHTNAPPPTVTVTQPVHMMPTPQPHLQATHQQFPTMQLPTQSFPSHLQANPLQPNLNPMLNPIGSTPFQLPSTTITFPSNAFNPALSLKPAFSPLGANVTNVNLNSPLNQNLSPLNPGLVPTPLNSSVLNANLPTNAQPMPHLLWGANPNAGLASHNPNAFFGQSLH